MFLSRSSFIRLTSNTMDSVAYLPHLNSSYLDQSVRQYYLNYHDTLKIHIIEMKYKFEMNNCVITYCPFIIYQPVPLPLSVRPPSCLLDVSENLYYMVLIKSYFWVALISDLRSWNYQTSQKWKFRVEWFSMWCYFDTDI